MRLLHASCYIILAIMTFLLFQLMSISWICLWAGTFGVTLVCPDTGFSFSEHKDLEKTTNLLPFPSKINASSSAQFMTGFTPEPVCTWRRTETSQIRSQRLIESLDLQRCGSVRLDGSSVRIFPLNKPSQKRKEGNAVLQLAINNQCLERSDKISLFNGFRRVRKIVNIDYSFVICVCHSLRLSTWNNSAPTALIFMKFNSLIFFESLSRKFKFH